MLIIYGLCNCLANLHFHRLVFENQKSLWLIYFLVLEGERNRDAIAKQDGRLAPAYFSPNYKYFDQLLQKVENKTTILNLVFKEFLQTSIPPLISVLYAKGCHDFPLKNFCLTVPKNLVEKSFCVSESFGYRKILCQREEYHDFL